MLGSKFCPEAAQLLLEFKADPNMDSVLPDSHPSDSPIVVAAFNGRFSCGLASFVRTCPAGLNSTSRFEAIVALRTGVKGDITWRSHRRKHKMDHRNCSGWMFARISSPSLSFWLSQPLDCSVS